MSEQQQQQQEFITVKFGDDQKKIFNPNCRTSSLLESIRRNCSVSELDKGKIDLLGEDGKFAQISRRSSRTPANLILNGRATYVLISIKGESRTPKYVSLLNDLQQIHPDLAEKLEALSSPPEMSERVKHSARSMKRINSRRSSIKISHQR